MKFWLFEMEYSNTDFFLSFQTPSQRYKIFLFLYLFLNIWLSKLKFKLRSLIQVPHFIHKSKCNPSESGNLMSILLLTNGGDNQFLYVHLFVKFNKCASVCSVHHVHFGHPLSMGLNWRPFLSPALIIFHETYFPLVHVSHLSSSSLLLKLGYKRLFVSKNCVFISTLRSLRVRSTY